MQYSFGVEKWVRQNESIITLINWPLMLHAIRFNSFEMDSNSEISFILFKVCRTFISLRQLYKMN